jgi:hypothetical protein
MEYAAYSTAPWYADGLRRIAALITRIADRLDKSEEPAPHHEHYAPRAEDHIAEIRHRIAARYY